MTLGPWQFTFWQITLSRNDCQEWMGGFGLLYPVGVQSPLLCRNKDTI
jgi:hypothetical protein